MQREFDKQKTEEPDEESRDEVKELKDEVRELKEELRTQVKQKEKQHFHHPPEHHPKPKFKGASRPGTLERAVLIGIIAILSAFIVVDLSFYHNGEIKQSNEAAVGMVASSINESLENETVEVAEEVVNESAAEENETAEAEEATAEQELSGKVELKINKIYRRKVNSDLGYITKASFTIKNGKEDVLKPVVRVYAYDKSLEDPWIEKDRGVFNYTAGIQPGGEQAGSIDLTPKTFTALNTLKTVSLRVFDDDKVVASAEEKFYIK